MLLALSGYITFQQLHTYCNSRQASCTLSLCIISALPINMLLLIQRVNFFFWMKGFYFMSDERKSPSLYTKYVA
jgi:hypothetical protein